MAKTFSVKLKKARRRLREILSASFSKKNLVDQFHRLYYENHEQTWNNTFWMGKRILKCPMDLWIYQEILFETKPDWIIECGTKHGGSAFFLANLCDLLGKGRVLTIDIETFPDRPTHPRIVYVKGSSTSSSVISIINQKIAKSDKVLVILDSDHSKSHVLEELKAYSQFVSKNGYLIVEDTNINDHPVSPEFGPGPMEALNAFLEESSDFEIDESREKFLLSFNPRGYLKRV